MLRKSRGHMSVTALDQINMEITEGERVALIGPNGAGKSTLLQVIAGIYEPQRGVVDVQGHVSPLFNSMIGINSDATGLENIRDRATLFGLSKVHTAKHIHELSDFSGLGDYLEMPVRSYSTGMRARLAFAMNLMLEPDIFLLDEWIGFVDRNFSESAEEKLLAVAKGAKVIVIATHNEQILERLCTRGLFLHKGRVLFDGDAIEALRRYYDSTA